VKLTDFSPNVLHAYRFLIRLRNAQEGEPRTALMRSKVFLAYYYLEMQKFKLVNIKATLAKTVF
jgi:hypothetical protein